MPKRLLITPQNLNGIFIDMLENEFPTQKEKLDMAMEDLRAKRNKLLSNCDWTDLPNAPLTEEKKIKWQNYRQQLRDLTNGITTVEQAKAVVFPNEVQ